MKKKNLNLKRKLFLNKIILTALNKEEQHKMAGGAGPTADPSACMTAPYTTPICCNASIVAKNTHCCPLTYPECYP